MIIAQRKMTEDDNLVRYRTPSVVSYYAAATQLQPAERELFNKYLQPNVSILDIGVGGGRTTPYLAELSHHYVGIDYGRRWFGRVALDTRANVSSCAMHQT